MTRFLSRLVTSITLAGVIACHGSDVWYDLSDDPLEGADAEWSPPPVPTPGGNGAGNSGDDDGAGDGGAGTTTSGGSGSGSGDGDGDGDGDGYGGYDGDYGGDGDGDYGGDGDGDGDGDGEPTFCAPALPGTSCDLTPGVCETIAGMTTALPCCEDPDCMCRGTECGALACQADSVCDCGCPDGVDPDCGVDACAEADLPLNQPMETDSCPGADEPVVLYMSNDDSNSQASPIIARHTIMQGGTVPKSQIRIHEFLNYYDLNNDLPTDTPVAIDAQLRRLSPGDEAFGLLLAVKGQIQSPETRPPLNLVLSVDTSGSMQGPPIDNLRHVVSAIATQLRQGDTVSVVEWDSSANVILDGYQVNSSTDTLLASIAENLNSGGGTDLSGGLMRAYELANKHRVSDGINRVVIISDGGANLGLTSANLIGSNAANAEADGILLVGIGVGHSGLAYSDALMDEMTDMGKGAYLYVDSEAEAHRMFADPVRFLSNLSIIARNVQVEVTLPWYFGIKKFSGEEFASTPEEIEPQHLAPNDTMNFHQVIESCAAGLASKSDEVSLHVTYIDPIDGSPQEATRAFSMQELVDSPATQLHKADVVVNYAEALIQIADKVQQGDLATARDYAANMAVWLDGAAVALQDSEVQEMAGLMTAYSQNL